MNLIGQVPQNCRTALIWPECSATDLDSLVDACPELHTLFIIANDPPTIPSAITGVCLRPTELDRLPSLLAEHDLLFAEGRVGCFVSDTQRAAYPEQSRQVETTLLAFTRDAVTRTAFRATKGWHILAGTMLNLPRIFESETIRCLQNVHRGAVVIVGAGPALDTDAALLTEVRKSFFVIACDAAWNTLIDHGIRPDLVLSTDSRDCTWQHLERGAAGQGEVPLVVPFSGSWSVVRNYPGRLLFMRQDWPLDRIIEQALDKPVPMMNTGKCVGNAAFELAKWVGAHSITLIGFNLGYDGENYHPQSRVVAEFEDHPHAQENLLTVPGNEGKTIRTDYSMYYYLKDFEHQIATTTIPTYNATTGGALIHGATRSRIAEIAQNHHHVPAAPPIPQDAPPTDPEKFLLLKQRLVTLSEDFLAMAVEILESLEDNIATTGGYPFPALAEQSIMVSILQTAENPAARASHLLSWEVMKKRPNNKAAKSNMLQAAQQYLMTNATITQLIPALLNLHPASPKTTGKWIAFVPNVNDEAWTELLWMLQTERGMEIEHFSGNRDDVTTIWQALKNAEGAIMLNGDLLPYEWAFPGAKCIDFVTTPPDGNALIEQWLPGYEIITLPEWHTAWDQRTPPGTNVSSISKAPAKREQHS